MQKKVSNLNVATHQNENLYLTYYPSYKAHNIHERTGRRRVFPIPALRYVTRDNYAQIVDLFPACSDRLACFDLWRKKGEWDETKRNRPETSVWDAEAVGGKFSLPMFKQITGACSVYFSVIHHSDQSKQSPVSGSKKRICDGFLSSLLLFLSVSGERIFFFPHSLQTACTLCKAAW